MEDDSDTAGCDDGTTDVVAVFILRVLVQFRWLAGSLQLLSQRTAPLMLSLSSLRSSSSHSYSSTAFNMRVVPLVLSPCK